MAVCHRRRGVRVLSVCTPELLRVWEKTRLSLRPLDIHRLIFRCSSGATSNFQKTLGVDGWQVYDKVANKYFTCKTECPPIAKLLFCNVEVLKIELFGMFDH